MAKIFPFRGYRFDLSKVDLSEVISPPLDTVDEKRIEELCKRSPYNVSRLVRTAGQAEEEPENRFSHAEELLEGWISESALKAEAMPCLYALFQRYEIGGEVYERKALVALVELETTIRVAPPFMESSPAGTDRYLALTKATGANITRVLAFYGDPSFRINRAMDADTAGRGPDLQVEDDLGVEHSLWKISDGGTISRLQKAMEDKQLTVAHGQEVYRAALKYVEYLNGQGIRVREGDGAAMVMMALVNIDAPGIAVRAGDGTCLLPDEISADTLVDTEMRGKKLPEGCGGFHPDIPDGIILRLLNRG